MPELPEVESITRRLRPAVIGRTIDSVEVLRRDIWSGPLTADELPGRTTVRLLRHGKSMLFELEPSLWLGVRLGMTGQLLVAPRNTPRPPHTHVVVTFAGEPLELRYRDPRRFGAWRVAKSLVEFDLAPDALTLRRATWERIVGTRSGMLRPLLMNQHIIAGLGNIYTNEALFAARLHPRQEASDLNDAQREALYRAIKSTLKEGIRWGGSTIRDYRTPDGASGRFQERFRVYDRAGLPCKRRCGARIQKLPAAKDAQPGFFCPRCQRVGVASRQSR
ncbi:MAG: bifunctional DNA-formamidopyrimidine glycosylase/DNA-(apurinic or apyrimidinic site) lyase [Nitrospirota bacterium]